MNYITRFIRVILELFNCYSSAKTTPERNRELDYINVLRSEIEEKKAIEARIESQQHEKNSSASNTVTMDVI